MKLKNEMKLHTGSFSTVVKSVEIILQVLLENPVEVI